MHWPVDAVDLGHFWVSFLELLILFEQWAGHRLLKEKVTRPHVRANRPILIPSAPVSEGVEIDMVVSFSAAWFERWPSCLVVLVGSCPCGVGSHMSRLRHLWWNQCSHGLTSRPLESCHHPCPKALCGVLVCPGGSALELLYGTLKLRHCTSILTMRFPPWILPRVGNVGGKRQFVAPGHLLDGGSNVAKRVRLNRKTRPGALFSHVPDPGHPTPRRWKRLRPLPPWEREVRWACLAIFFLALGLCEFCTGDAWNLPSEGTGVGGFRLVSPAEGTSALALVHFY